MTPEELSRNITEAVRAHGTWKFRLRRAVDTGELPKPARDIACDDQCGFGKWLHGLKSDPSIAAKSEYRDVLRAHAAFPGTSSSGVAEPICASATNVRTVVQGAASAHVSHTASSGGRACAC